MNLQGSQASSESYLSQATEVLAQSVQLGLQGAQRELVAAACLELVECCGQFDQALASHYLALYQVSNISSEKFKCITCQILQQLYQLPITSVVKTCAWYP